MGVFLVLAVLDRTRWSDIVAIHAWALFGANSWIARRYKQEVAKPLLTSLEL
jgi:predicted nicotinamide N-methyase